MGNFPFVSNLPELEIAFQAAIEAGKAVMDVYKKDFSSKQKSDNSPITEADLKSNEIIKRILSKTDHFILSEEDKDDEKRLELNKVWIVDPLDGTTDFVNRTGEFTVMIALVENKKPILGIINWPIEKTLFVAQKNCGSWKFSGDSWEKISVSKTSELNKCRAVGSRHHISEEEKNLLNRLQINQFSSIGSSLKVGKVSSGSAEIYLTTTNKMKEWDTCASYCIVNEAGGRITDMFGRDISYNNKVLNHQDGILVTNGLVHDKIIKEYQKSTLRLSA